MALLEVSNITKRFDRTKAVDRVSLTIEKGALVCLLGPSGCGKTTLLRLIAGLEQPDEGTVLFEGRSLNGKPAEERGFGLMFQDLALFPHMDVLGNVAFGLRMQHLPKDQIYKRVDELLDLIDMTAYKHRRMHELSGGERQRVALARALAPAPRLLMLDEPLGSLDRVLRESLQNQLRTILREVGVTSIYVTHDREEAFVMADKLVFMDKGQIIQDGIPQEIFNNPCNEFVARSLGFKNILEGVVKKNGSFVEISNELGLILADPKQSNRLADGDEVTILIDESGIDIGPPNLESKSCENRLFGTITEMIFMGGQYEVKIQIGRTLITSSISLESLMGDVRNNMEVGVTICPSAIKLLRSP